MQRIRLGVASCYMLCTAVCQLLPRPKWKRSPALISSEKVTNVWKITSQKDAKHIPKAQHGSKNQRYIQMHRRSLHRCHRMFGLVLSLWCHSRLKGLDSLLRTVFGKFGRTGCCRFALMQMCWAGMLEKETCWHRILLNVCKRADLAEAKILKINNSKHVWFLVTPVHIWSKIQQCWIFQSTTSVSDFNMA